jgi:hypothetical protein
MTLDALFTAAGLSPCGPVRWGEACAEQDSGVYVVVVDDAIVYIGRTRRPLSRRIREFYRHRYGDKRPHRGGQELFRIPGDRIVYWCPTADPCEAETKMLRAFEDFYGRLPAANRRRGDRGARNGQIAAP